MRADSQVAELCDDLQLAERFCWDRIDAALHFVQVTLAGESHVKLARDS